MSKPCKYCGIILTEDEFSPDIRALDGLQSRCRNCNNQSQRERYQTDIESKVKKLESNKLYRKQEVSRYRNEWRGSVEPVGLSGLRFAIATKAEEIAFRSILPNEEFTDIIWLNNHHAPFDILALKDNQRYSIDVTIAPYKTYGLKQQSSGNQRALAWLCRNLALRHLVLFISPDLTRYVFKEMSANVKCLALAKKDIERAVIISK